MSSPDWSAPEQWLSMLGASLILFAYAVMVTRPEKKRFCFLVSLLGGICLLLMAWLYRNVGLMLLELAWIGINLWGLFGSRKESV